MRRLIGFLKPWQKTYVLMMKRNPVLDNDIGISSASWGCFRRDEEGLISRNSAIKSYRTPDVEPRKERDKSEKTYREKAAMMRSVTVMA